MRLVVDLQGAQGANRIREIGRYCVLLTRGLARLRGKHEVIVVLSALFPDTIEPLRRSLEEVLPPESIRVMHLVGPVSGADPHSDARREAAELLREYFLASLNPDFVLITSLFEGLDDDVVSSIGRFTTRIPIATMLYDLISRSNRDVHFQSSVLAKWYERKLAHLRNADLMLTTSQSSQRKAIDWLGAAENEVVNISIAAEDHFTPALIDTDRWLTLSKAYGIVRPFIMHTGGIGHGTNVEGLIEAYAMLPTALRREHQLAVVCSIQPADQERLRALGDKHGLGSDELILTGYIPDDDLLTCYQACKLFIFTSWLGGFGLSALQAMQCGRAVIASDDPILLELIGSSEALFDPHDIGAISEAIRVVITDERLRTKLEKYGFEQAKKFSWDATAGAAWDALQAAHKFRNAPVPNGPSDRPRMAYFSPLPPEAGGVSDYNAELLPELARHYRIDVIVSQRKVSDVQITANHPVRSIEWFKRHAHVFDRILYHFSNSNFHSHMFDLIQKYPGVVVLHDFFLSDIIAHRDINGEDPGGWARALFEAHGWPAVVHRFKAADTADVVRAYPCNMAVLQNALGIIVHTDFLRQLAQAYYGQSVGLDWTLTTHLSQPARGFDRTVAREILGFCSNDFVVCSFGVAGLIAMNDRLLSAWLESPLADNPDCHLIFVGQNDPGAYEELERRIRSARVTGRIEITNCVDRATFHDWLAAADIGVQLHAQSRADTSAIVFDCMNAGLPTIVNANGPMVELPVDCVWLMPSNFTDETLVEALVTLHADAARRRDMGERARAQIANHHNPRHCALAYSKAIEAAYKRAEIGQTSLERALVEQGDEGLREDDWHSLVQAMGRNTPLPLRRKRLLIDVSELIQRDSRSGIQRVVRSILGHWLLNPPADYIVEPVYAVLNELGYRYARHFSSHMLDICSNWSEDDIVEPASGDIFVGLDLQPAIIPQQQSLLQEWRRMGVTVRFVIYDLLPAIAPEFFFPGARLHHHAWLKTISHFDGVICISRAVADEYSEWLNHYGPERITPLEIDWFHLGCDMGTQRLETGDLPLGSEETLDRLRSVPSFLSVATVEPRKGFRQTLDAIELLWAKGTDVNFAIVGKPGWMMEDFIARLQGHPELGNRLFWLQGISDEYLHAVYGSCRYLIAASQGEGFGLPLIEAARYGLPVLARDIPVFREVAENAATYFPNSMDPAILAQSIESLLKPREEIIKPPRMKWLTWAQSAEMLFACTTRQTLSYLQWMPDEAHRFWGSDERLHSQVGVSEGTRIRTTAKSGFLIFGPYMPLEAGRWKIRARGNTTYLDGSETMDIVSSKGTKVHFSKPLVRSGNEWMVEGDYVMTERAEGVEIRLWVSDDSDLSLAGISLSPEAA